MKSRHGQIHFGVWLWPALSILMLIGMIAEARTHVQPSVAEPHLARCAAAIDEFPMIIQGASGVWMGSDKEVPQSATTLLRPNRILCREYLNDETKMVATLLLVDCGDARDLQGHYPPNCYPAQGQKLLDQKPRVWHLPHMDIDGMEYHFGPKSPTEQDQVVYNFFVMPVAPGRTVSHKELDGVICPDITSVYTSGEDYQRRYYGAAEFQLITGPRMTPAQRDQALLELLGPNEKLIRILENRNPGGN